jgi:drug/metabolite transporter (DMT)-like permease
MAMASPRTKVPLAESRLALFAALLTVCLWASAFVGIRYAGRELGPGPLSLARLLVASVALGVMMLVRHPLLVNVAPLFIAPGLMHQVSHAGAAALAWTVYLGLVPTAIGFSTWAYALSRTGWRWHASARGSHRILA